MIEAISEEKYRTVFLNERIVTRRYELLLKVYYLKAVQTMEMSVYTFSIYLYIHRNNIKGCYQTEAC